MSFGLADAVLGALTLKQCTQATRQGNTQISAARGSGNVFADAHFVDKMPAVYSFTTQDIATMLAANSGAFASSGLQVSGADIILPFRTRAAGGTYAGSGSHTTVTLQNGLIVPTSLTAESSSASLGLEVMLESTDGETAPETIATNASQSNGSFNAMHQLGPCTINGAAFTGISGYTVNYGLTVESNVEDDGNIVPTQHFILLVNPTIDVRFNSKAAYEAFGAFTAMSAAVFGLRKKAPGGTLVAKGTAEHITHTFADGIISTEDISGSEGSRGQYSLRLTGESLTVSTAATFS